MSVLEVLNLFKFVRISTNVTRRTCVTRTTTFTRKKRTVTQCKEINEKLDFFRKFLEGKRSISIETFHQKYPCLLSTPISHITDNLNALGKLGVDKRQINSKSLMIFSLSTVILKRRYASLKELGMTTVGPSELLGYADIMKTNLNVLRKMNYIDSNEDQFKNLLAKLDCPQELEKEICLLCTSYYDLSIGELYERISICIIRYYLNLSADDAETYYKTIDVSDGSLINLKETLIFLIHELQIDPECIVFHPEMLRGTVADLKELKRIFDFYKLEYKQIFISVPFIFTRPSEHIKQMYTYLLDFGVPVEHIDIRRLISCNPTFIQQALKSMATWPEIHVYKCNPNFMELLVNYKTVDVRLRYLKNSGFERFDINLLTSPNTKFQSHLNEHVEKSATESIAYYLSRKLDRPTEEIQKMILSHPIGCKSSVTSVKTNLNYLIDEGFSKEQIFNGLSAVFYPTHQFGKGMKRLRSSSISLSLEDRTKSSYAIQLLLYFIETDVISTAK
ncbi:hypothetical protein CHUAL_002506 [Chamberlinius hualienensis]